MLLFVVLCRDKKERRREKQKGHQNGETSPTHNSVQSGESGVENPDFNKEVLKRLYKAVSLWSLLFFLTVRYLFKQ